MEPQILPIGVQSFEKLRQNNRIYVDKTQYIYNLVTQGEVYFLSRPRRFGKSLLTYTLQSLFESKRELFKDLWIDKSDWDWPKHPVVRLDMSLLKNVTAESLEKGLCHQVHKAAKIHGISLQTNAPAQVLLEDLIDDLADKQGPVVALVDEYDAPIVNHLGKDDKALEIAEANRDVLKGFYTVFKAKSDRLRFLFITGVSRFSKVSIFSDLGHLDDITMADEYAGMLGYTQEELESNFALHLESLSQKTKLSKQQLLAKIRHWYNGYRFSEEDLRVYNPFSTLLLFQRRRFRDYWFATGTPTFLVNLMKNQMTLEPKFLAGLQTGLDAFENFELEKPRRSLLTLLLQTGYLTIEDCWMQEDEIDGETVYRLNYPNREVQRGFVQHLLRGYSHVGIVSSPAELLVEALQANRLKDFFRHLRVFFASVPYDIQIPAEKYYQSLFYLIHQMLGFQIAAEVRTNDGRVDTVLETDDRIFLFEFKFIEIPSENHDHVQTRLIASQGKNEGNGLDSRLCGNDNRGGNDNKEWIAPSPSQMAPRNDEERAAQAALEQIKRKKYYEKYLDKNKPITLVGAAFCMPPEDCKDGKRGSRQLGQWVAQEVSK